MTSVRLICPLEVIYCDSVASLSTHIPHGEKKKMDQSELYNILEVLYTVV